MKTIDLIIIIIFIINYRLIIIKSMVKTITTGAGFN